MCLVQLDMKKIITLLALALILYGCMGTDYEHEVPPMLRISKAVNTLRVSDMYTYEHEYTNELAQPEEVMVSWESTNENVMSIDASGKVTAHQEGVTTLIVRFGELMDHQEVQVLPSKESITISDYVTTLEVGQSYDFEYVYLNTSGQKEVPESVEWSTSQMDILTVDSEGVVTAQSVGTASITVMVGEVMHTVEVEASSAPASVSEEVRITMFTQAMETGTTFRFEAQYYDTSGQPDNSVEISWASSSTAVATVSSSGLVSALAAGSTTITAEAGGMSMSVVLEVTEPAPRERTTVLRGSGGYNIQGDVTLKLENNVLSLVVENARKEGPGPYYYLSNQLTNVNGGVKLGEAVNGNITINITDKFPNVNLDTYDYVIVWCEPFSVRLGYGELSN